MVQWRVMLGAVVASVDTPGDPIKTELISGGAAMQPVEPQVHKFGLMRHKCVVSDAGGDVIVSLKGSKWLQPTHFNECLA